MTPQPIFLLSDAPGFGFAYFKINATVETFISSVKQIKRLFAFDVEYNEMCDARVKKYENTELSRKLGLQVKIAELREDLEEKRTGKKIKRRRKINFAKPKPAKKKIKTPSDDMSKTSSVMAAEMMAKDKAKRRADITAILNRPHY